MIFAWVPFAGPSRSLARPPLPIWGVWVGEGLGVAELRALNRGDVLVTTRRRQHPDPGPCASFGASRSHPTSETKSGRVLAGQLLEAVGQPIKLPRPGELRCLSPGRLLVRERRQGRRRVHGCDRAIEPQRI